MSSLLALLHRYMRLITMDISQSALAACPYLESLVDSSCSTLEGIDPGDDLIVDGMFCIKWDFKATSKTILVKTMPVVWLSTWCVIYGDNLV